MEIIILDIKVQKSDLKEYKYQVPIETGQGT